MEEFKEKNSCKKKRLVWDDKRNCTGCGACSYRCARQAIVMHPDEEGFLYPYIDVNKCTDCGLCQKICPQTSGNKYLNTNASLYGGVVKENKILMDSSSGGAFSAICQLFNEDAIVYGCMYDGQMKVVHDCAPNTSAISKFRKSKYLQSDIRGIYSEIKQQLDNGETVIFSGTSCQVAGLYAYLNGKPNNLLTIDLVCHGVPSQKVFDSYLASLSKQFGQRITIYSFREKSYFWGDWEIGVKFGNGSKTRYRAWGEDCYMTGFLRGLFYRPACYCCKYANKEIHRPADFTIGDFWGCAKINNEFHEKKGCSLIIANSTKAKNLIPSLSEYMLLSPVDADTAIKENHNLIEPTKWNVQRPEFFQMLQRGIDFDEIIKTIYKGKARSHSQKVRVIMTKLLPWLVKSRRKKIMQERKNR